MRKYFIIFMWLLLGAACAYSQTGVWSGDLEVQGMKLPLVFHLDDDNATIDSPAQGVRGLPINIVRHSSDSLSITIPSISALFEGRYKNDVIAGTFTQRGFKFPLVLKPGEKKSLRPQTPRAPFPYKQEEVSFSNGDAVLKGTLTLPEGCSRETPVVIMITGSGLQNRDEEVWEHKPFAVTADALAREGIASLRYDDRGFGESTGDVVNCTTEDLKNDALAGIELLRGKFNRVGVLGHSEGGTIALMLGADNKVDFIVSMAGMVVSGKETLLNQNRESLSKANYPQQTVDDYCNLLSSAFDNDDSLPQKLETTALPPELKKNLTAVMQQLKLPYLNYFVRLDLRDSLAKIACPVLALNGTKDTQVACRSNLKALRDGLPSNANTKIISLENLNHLFQHCDTGAMAEYSTIEETISPEVLEIICQWIKLL